MIKKWEILYWLNLFVILINWSVVTCMAIPQDTWFIMPCMIILIMSCVPPAVISLAVWRKLHGKDIGSVYLNALFVRKTKFSFSVLLILLGWFWWANSLTAILFGTVMASWGSAVVFWRVGNKDLDAVLPEFKYNRNKPHTTFSENYHCNNTMARPSLNASRGIESVPALHYANESLLNPNSSVSNLSHSTTLGLSNPLTSNFEDLFSTAPAINPASGMPMVNDAVDCYGNVYGTNSTGSDY